MKQNSGDSSMIYRFWYKRNAELQSRVATEEGTRVTLGLADIT